VSGDGVDQERLCNERRDRRNLKRLPASVPIKFMDQGVRLPYFKFSEKSHQLIHRNQRPRADFFFWPFSQARAV